MKFTAENHVPQKEKGTVISSWSCTFGLYRTF